MAKRFDLAIINRSFWPKDQILGESLMQIAERASIEKKSTVILTQYTGNLEKIAKKFGRGLNLKFRSCKERSDSSSKLFFRIIDVIIFTLWVCWNLLVNRPKKIYVSTNPPLIVPFAVFIYSKIFNATYVYHLQDIHPELTNVAIKLNPVLFLFFKKVDGLVLRHASSIITITQTMKNEIIKRSNTKSHIYLIDNPAANYNPTTHKRVKGFIFSGNLGRLQKIPLLLKSIKRYKDEGGSLPFLLIGGGLFAEEARLLSTKYKDIKFERLVDVKKAYELSYKYEWALLPIDDEATKYAFPSKTSSYVSCGLKILSICSNHTIVAKWILKNNYGINSLPNIDDLVNIFFKIEKGLTFNNTVGESDYFSIKNYVQRLFNILFELKEF